MRVVCNCVLEMIDPDMPLVRFETEIKYVRYIYDVLRTNILSDRDIVGCLNVVCLIRSVRFF